MRTDFWCVIFTDECRATLVGSDGWAREWISFNNSVPVLARRQHGGGGVMFWVAIVTFWVEDGVKIDSEDYCAFLNKHFRP